jgi:hypothetical protein
LSQQFCGRGRAAKGGQLNEERAAAAHLFGDANAAAVLDSVVELLPQMEAADATVIARAWL